MSPDNKPFLKWFGYSRRERRSTFILLIVIFLVIALRYVMPGENINIEDISASLNSLSDTLLFNNVVSGETINSFVFDTGKTSITTLKSSGISEKLEGKAEHYRDKAAIYNEPSSQARIYNVDKNLSKRPTRYVKMGNDTASYSKNRSIQSNKIDLNNCDSILLDRLPGIGRVLSVRIIKYRNLLGGFISSEQLKEVYGLSVETYNRISERVFAGSSFVKQINVNNAGFNDLIRHPYFERNDVQAILKYRELNGRIRSLVELTDNKILTREKATRVGPYLSFGN